MNTRERIRTIHLIELMNKQPDYSQHIGLSSTELTKGKEEKKCQSEEQEATVE